jgi:2-dehydro-3-deoxygluconokinase
MESKKPEIDAPASKMLGKLQGKADEQAYDVVSIGETMLRFSPPIPLRLEQANVMELHIGGSESNTLVGLSRLGARACWISRLPDHSLGQQVARLIAMHGVDTSHVVWTSEDRLGVYFYEPACFPRSGEVIYDRKDSAFTKFTYQQIPCHPLESCRWFHATGISLALNPTVRTTMEFARDYARRHGACVSFDFNYRSKLWSIEQARVGCLPWVESSDLVFFAKRDAIALLELTSDSSDQEVVEALAKFRDGKCSVVTLGQHGAIAAESGQVCHVGTKKVDGAGRLGGGDAFSAGFLYARLAGFLMADALAWANAMAGLKYSIPGDMPIVHKQDIERWLDQSTPAGVRR